MTARNVDGAGRYRCKTVAFRVSPEEADLLQRLADISGMTKQDYLISLALERKVIVMPNKRMQLYMEESMLHVYRELRRIERAGDMPDELASLVEQICTILIGLGHDSEGASISRLGQRGWEAVCSNSWRCSMKGTRI